MSRAPNGPRRARGLHCLAALCALAVLATPAQAARTVGKPERAALLAAAAASPAGEVVSLRVGRGGRATIAPAGLTMPAEVQAWKSSIDGSWALLVAAPRGNQPQHRAFLLQRSGGRWRVRLAADRGEIAEQTCRRATPRAAVALDLALRTDGYSGRCRHHRNRQTLVRPMRAAELASVRRMVEWVFDESTFERTPGPVQPRAHDVFASNCSWDGRGEMVAPPHGEVARADPRWGLVSIFCVIGSDGFAQIESVTVMLVQRAGRTGPFTGVPAHTMPSWSSYGGLCSTDRSWPVPANARVALEFCSPFPLALRNALR